MRARSIRSLKLHSTRFIPRMHDPRGVKMAADQTVLLRNVLSELRSIRFRLDRQVAVVQRLIKISQKPPTKKKISKKKTKTAKATKKKVGNASVGYVKERKVLARRLQKKALR